MKYRMKAVIFDVLTDCKEIKQELQSVGIQVSSPFFGVQSKSTLKQELERLKLAPEECLFLTNQAEHAAEAKECGMVVIGCIEGHFKIPCTSILLTSPEEVSVSYLNRVFCHERKLPADILETPRLVVRELTEEDSERLYEILTDKEVCRYLPAMTGTKEEEIEKLNAYASHVYSFFEYGYWGVFLKDGGELIGRAGFREDSYPPEAGYLIARQHWGKGYATEVLEHLVRYAIEEMDGTTLQVKIEKENIASIRVAERCGFRPVTETEEKMLLYQYDM